MPVTNLMHDIVINTVDAVLEKEVENDITGINRDEIIAYVLNRVPPKYVTSERGLLYGVLDARYKIQQQVDILLLIYEAIQKISHRRDSNAAIKEIARPGKTSFLPHIIGQVLEESTLAVIPDVEISLNRAGSRAVMIDSDWENPCKTKLSTRGHYHFWPQFVESEMGDAHSIPFTIAFTHPRCALHAIDIDLEVIHKTDFGKSWFIPTVLMKIQEDSSSDSVPAR